MEIATLFAGIFFGSGLAMWISVLSHNKKKIQELIGKKDNISRDFLGRPKKSVIIKKEESIDKLLEK